VTGGATGQAGTGGEPGGTGAGGTSGSSGAGGSFGVCTEPQARAVSVFMIGDSTMSVYDASLYPRMGWGQPLGELFSAECAVVVDKAVSGTSSKSFFDRGDWAPIKDELEQGDYVLIQFAHNDEKSDDATRYTEPQTTYKQYLTTYVTDTREKGATPLLLTPVNRNNWSGGGLSDSHGAYPPAMRELAVELAVELVDLTALSKEYFERIGQAETTALFLNLAPGEFPNYPNGNSDNTHFQERGARLIGQLAMADAFAQKLTLASYLALVPTAP
jgi:lysophospholipase L1-like esterase